MCDVSVMCIDSAESFHDRQCLLTLFLSISSQGKWRGREGLDLVVEPPILLVQATPFTPYFPPYLVPVRPLPLRLSVLCFSLSPSEERHLEMGKGRGRGGAGRQREGGRETFRAESWREELRNYMLCGRAGGGQ